MTSSRRDSNRQDEKDDDPPTEDEEGIVSMQEDEMIDFGFFYWPGGIFILNFGTHESPKDLIGSSAYAYFLINNLWACLLALVVVVFQMYLFWILWVGSEEVTNEDFQDDSDYIIGLIGASFMLALRVLPHLGRSMELFFMGTGLTRTFKSKQVHLRQCDIRLVVVGLLDMLVAAACVCVGVRYALNQGSSTLRTITIATIAVFIEGIDEYMYNFLDYWSRPAWIRWKNYQIEKSYGNREVFLKRQQSKIRSGRKSSSGNKKLAPVVLGSEEESERPESIPYSTTEEA